jgi:predicted phage baseplate assembly protein
MQPPPIDTRSYADLVAETEQLAQQLSGWRPAPDGQPDPGAAIIRIFGRFVELVVQRINRAPERNELAFLNLIGTSPLPPRPARVPLTFSLASGSPVDAAVPAGTLAGAPPVPPATDDVLFETERDLVVTRAVLTDVVVSDTETDTYSDRTAEATGLLDAPFAAFSGDQFSPHHLYIAVAPRSAPSDLPLELQTPDSWQWLNWPITWEYWDGDGWQPAVSRAQVSQGAWRVTLSQLPKLPAYGIDGVEGGWVRARVGLPLAPGTSGTVPDSIALATRRPQDFASGLTVLSESPGRFYLSAHEDFGAGLARARLRFRLATPGAPGPAGAAGGLQLTWSYQAGAAGTGGAGGATGWVQLGQSSTGAQQVGPNPFGLTDGTLALTQDGEVSFHVPLDWPSEMYRTRTGRWLRVDVAAGGPYRTAPQIADIQVSHDWELPRLTGITTGGAPVLAARSYNDFTYAERVATPFAPTADTEPALYLGLDQPFDDRPISVYLQAEPPRPEEVAADALAETDPAAQPVLSWEYDAPDGPRSLGARDETQGLGMSGLVSFAAPRDLTERSRFGRSRYWLRARWQRGTFPLPPRLRRVSLNTMWATQAATVHDEILGSSNGNPRQMFTTAQAPVLPGHQLVVRESGQADEVWVPWDAQPDLYDSGPQDRHYTIDALSGEISFGDGSSGRIPPPGQNNVRITYQTGGGEQGNRDAETIMELKSAIPYIDGVTNHEAATGGAATEPVDRAAGRGTRALRHRDRAVTAADLEDLATAASPAVARAAAVVPTFNPFSLWLDPEAAPSADHVAVDAGRAGVVIVPGDAATDRPTPSLGLLREVHDYLQARFPEDADLWVAGPEWIGVLVDATVVPVSLAEADEVGARVRAAIESYLHPLTGGPAGGGWAFGRKPHQSDLYTVIMAVSGVDDVRELTVSLEPDTADSERRAALQRMLRRPLTETSDRPELERELQRWIDRALVYSGQHEISVAP